MSAANWDNYRWLVGAAAEIWLERAAASLGDPLGALRQLRRDLSAERAALVLEQAALRARGKRKFPNAERLFFTAQGLEQATDATIAAYKARRFPLGLVGDFCCGIGGDLMALAARGLDAMTLGVDRDKVCALFAAENAACATRPFDIAAVRVQGFAAWHIDPDRRPSGRRTTRIELHEPSADRIDALLAAKEHAAVKLAPAAVVPDHWAGRAELEWIGHDRQCQQLVAWFGALAERPGERRATVLDAKQQPRSLVGRPNEACGVAEKIGRYLYEPHAAILAARLSGSLARLHGLEAIATNIAYLTADALVADAALARFEVLETLPFRLERVKAALRARNAGTLEIKKRGVDADPDRLRRQLACDGDEPLTLVVTRQAGKTIAAIARRM